MKNTMKNTITMAQRIALADFLRRDYADSMMHDAEFAAHATEMLGFSVSRSHILTLRVALKIDNNHRPKSSRAPADWVSVAMMLQDRIHALEAALQAINNKGRAL